MRGSTRASVGSVENRRGRFDFAADMG